MKSILVIDMPKSCEECQFCGRGGRNLEKYVCCLTREHSEKPHLVGCPLKPLPTQFKTYKLSQRDQEETELFINMAMIKVYADGYNACLKEIEGD